MSDWLKTKGFPLVWATFTIWNLRNNINWFLEVRDYYFSFGSAVTGIYLNIFQLMMAVTIYFELNKKPVLGELISIIFGTLMLISWQLIMFRYGDIIRTFDNAMVIIMGVFCIFLGIIRLIRLARR